MFTLKVGLLSCCNYVVLEEQRLKCNYVEVNLLIPIKLQHIFVNGRSFFSKYSSVFEFQCRFLRTEMSSMIFFRAIKRLYTVNVSSRQVMLSGNVLMLIASLTRCMILCRRIWMVQNSWNIGYRRRWMPAFLTFSSMKTRIPSFSSSTSSSMKMLTVWSSYSLYYSYYLYI